MKITPLEFGGVWILHPEILEFGFYPLKFRSVWSLHIDILKFGINPLKFGCVWILHPKFKFQGIKSKHPKT